MVAHLHGLGNEQGHSAATEILDAEGDWEPLARRVDRMVKYPTEVAVDTASPLARISSISGMVSRGIKVIAVMT